MIESEPLSLFALGGHIIIVVLVGLRVVLKRRAVGVSLAWLILILAIPLAGVIFYALIGEPPLGYRRAKKAKNLLGHYQKWLQGLDYNAQLESLKLSYEQTPLHNLAQSLIQIPAMAGNELVLYHDSDLVLEQIAKDIGQAKHTCHLEFYIWQEGGKVDAIIQALIQAVQRGVCCRVLVDAVGSDKFCQSKQFKQLIAQGIQIHAALPANPLRMLFRRVDLRLHRKLVVIDDKLAWTGSLNMVDPFYFKTSAKVGQWVDAMVRLTGPVVLSLNAMFVWDWELETGEGLEILHPPAPTTINDKLFLGQASIQVVPSGPGYSKGSISELLLTAIYGAREELIMTTPYFVPDESLQTALICAAHRNVKVIIIVPAKVDSVLVRYASMAYYDELVHAGVEIYRYTRGLLHTKSITIDSQTALFGTVNLDMRSLWLNFELTLCVYDENFGRHLRALQKSYLNYSEPLNTPSWENRGVKKRILENTAQLLGPLL